VVKRNAPSNTFEVDPSRFSLPEGLSPPDPGSVVLVLAEEGARVAGWTGRLAVDLAAAWGAGGAQVVLADADVSHAPLHGLLGEENGEGMSDHVLFGASLERVARPLSGRPFLFASAGTAVGDPEETLRSSRWASCFSAARGSPSTLVLYLPADSFGASPLLVEADRVVRLVAEPPAEAAPADSKEVTFYPAPAPQTPGRSASQSEGLPRLKVLEAKKLQDIGRARRVTGVVVLVLLVLVLAVLVAIWLGYIAIPEISPGVSSDVTPSPAVPLSLAMPG
jgi:hypothetical protein